MGEESRATTSASPCYKMARIVKLKGCRTTSDDAVRRRRKEKKKGKGKERKIAWIVKLKGCCEGCNER